MHLPGKSHGWRSLVGCSPWGRLELGTTERLHFDFSLSCIGEGNGNPLQCSCLENPRDEAWWAAFYGVTQSRTRLTRLSSSTSVFGDFNQYVSQGLESPGESGFEKGRSIYGWRKVFVLIWVIVILCVLIGKFQWKGGNCWFRRWWGRFQE